MKKHFVFGILCAAFILIFSGTDLSAQTGQLETKITLSWTEGIVRCIIKAPLDLDAIPFPRARREAEMEITKAAPGIFLSSIQDVAYDSYYSIGEFIASLPGTMERKNILDMLAAVSNKGLKKKTIISEDYHFLEITYEYSLFGMEGVFAPFVRHTAIVPFFGKPGYYPARNYSGIIIYAKDPLPAFGKNGDVLAKSALLPKIHILDSEKSTVQNEQIQPLFASYMANPDTIKKWGLTGYSFSSDENNYLERVGKFPLKIIAYGVYGKNNTDLIITEESARQILSKEENMDLLRQGRVMVVISDPNAPPE